MTGYSPQPKPSAQRIKIDTSARDNKRSATKDDLVAMRAKVDGRQHSVVVLIDGEPVFVDGAARVTQVQSIDGATNIAARSDGAYVVITIHILEDEEPCQP